jgi:cation diffusion facilitator CzcD-associated flavoprotein CzcO
VLDAGPRDHGGMTVQESMGRVGLPMPVAEMAARRWDVVVVGGGHNGLTTAAYLARAGRSVLVLEAREQLGGAATLQEPFPGYLISRARTWSGCCTRSWCRSWT